MTIVGGFDVHRRQITYNVVDTDTGEVRTGRIAPADRPHLRVWLAQQFNAGSDVHIALESGTGWRYVVEEITAAGLTAHLAEPAQTADKRGRKRRAKTDRADARLLRDLLLKGDLPQCWTPPRIVLDCRAILETYRDLREQHEGWVQRIQSVLFHHGVPHLGALKMATDAGRERLREAVATHLPATARGQVAVALRRVAQLDDDIDRLHLQIKQIARRMRGPRLLCEKIYGVGPVTALALTCWLGGAGRGFSSRGAVRFTGLDVTVKSSDGRHLGGGHLSRQGPPVLRWALYEAAKTSSRSTAPDHEYYAQVKDRIDGKRAALAEARKITREAKHLLAGLGDEAFIVDPPHPNSKPVPMIDASA
jgi:transposase